MRNGIVKRTLVLTICSKYDVVVVPFPFTESPYKQRPRPVAVLNNPEYTKETGNFLGIMISSSASHTAFDEPLQDLDDIGLVFESWLKPKIATLPAGFIKKNLGGLSKRDQVAMERLMVAIT